MCEGLEGARAGGGDTGEPLDAARVGAAEEKGGGDGCGEDYTMGGRATWTRTNCSVLTTLLRGGEAVWELQ